ncbi:MAG: Tad domain-containing protein [Chloroflexota bacterium]|nr:Tad domain-containing protein [Chloroflexota bacterium]
MRRFGGDDAGQMIVLFGLMLTVLVFSVGIAFNLGTLFVARRSLQEAADAASFGGAVVLFNGGTGTAAESAAQTDFQSNSFTLPDPNIAFAAHSPPWAGEPHAGDAAYIYVTVSQSVRTPLLPAEGGLTSVTVRSTAGSVRTPSGYALLALNATAPSSLYLFSTGATTVSNGDVQVDSNSATAAVKTAGSFVLNTGVTARAVGGQTGFTNMQTGQASVADPLSGYLRPSLSGLTPHGNVTVLSSTTLDPGTYKNLIINCVFGCTVTFNPGLYVLLGGGLQAINTATLSGTGVTFFNTLQNYPTETGSCGAVTIAVNSNVTISAPTSGYYSGMLFFQDPSCTQMLAITANGSITSSNGSIYAPKATVEIAGTNTISIGGQIIGDMVWVAGGASVNINYDTATVASPNLPALVSTP